MSGAGPLIAAASIVRRRTRTPRNNDGRYSSEWFLRNGLHNLTHQLGETIEDILSNGHPHPGRVGRHEFSGHVYTGSVEYDTGERYDAEGKFFPGTQAIRMFVTTVQGETCVILSSLTPLRIKAFPLGTRKAEALAPFAIMKLAAKDGKPQVVSSAALASIPDASVLPAKAKAINAWRISHFDKVYNLKSDAQVYDTCVKTCVDTAIACINEAASRAMDDLNDPELRSERDAELKRQQRRAAIVIAATIPAIVS